MSDRSIFLAALDIADPAARSAYLDEACAGEPNLRSQVEQLIAAHGEASGFMLRPAGALLATLDEPIAERPGTFIGHYKLLEKIGEGGFGVVFMAEQQEPVRRKVALKVLKPGMDTRQVVARFEAERQALALMDHPHIAHVFDGGTTDTGRPYFVMELVRGIPLTDFCDDNCLTIRQRLELFVDVCQAVQHAHQKGIIHRDLKPTNVMVTLHDGQPVAKVIDFGIAKAMGQQLTEKTLFTHFAQMIGTPLYMSPEQAEMSGLDIDTRSDIYSLGVLLYELLTGTTPFDRQRLSKVGYDEMRRIIREEEPPKPSTRISTVGKLATTSCQQRQSDPRKLSRLFRGELDWIVMKALEKGRDRRYETANGLAADVRRYLNDEPVRACPPSAVYRFRKFARRNGRMLATVAVVAMALVAGTVISTWQALRATDAETLAEERLEAEKQAHAEAVANLGKAREAGEEFFTLVSESKLLEEPGLQPLRKDLLEAAVRYYEGLAALREANDPESLADLAVAQLRMVQIYHQTGFQEPHVSALEKAVALTEKLLNECPDDAALHAELAGFWHGGRIIAELGQRADGERVIRAYRSAIAVWQRLVQRHPDVIGFQSDLSKFYDMLADRQIEAGRQEEAFESRQRVREIRERIVKNDPGVYDHIAELSHSYRRVAEAIEDSDVEEAETLYRRAVEMQKDAPDVPNYQEFLALAHIDLAKFLAKQKRPQEAMRHHREACRVFEKLVARFPHVSNYRGTLDLWNQELRALELRSPAAGILQNAETLKASGSLEGALAEYSQAVQLAPQNATGWLQRGRTHRTLREYDKAVADFSKAIELEPNSESARLELAWLHNAAGWRLREGNEELEAEREHRKALALLEELATDFPENFFYQTEWAEVLDTVAEFLRDRGDLAEAQRLLEQAVLHQRIFLESSAPQRPLYQSRLLRHLVRLADVLARSEQPVQAENTVAQAVALAQEFDVAGSMSDRAEIGFNYRRCAALLARQANHGAEADDMCRRDIGVFEKLTHDFPNDPAWAEQLAHAYRLWGFRLSGTGRQAEAQSAFGDAVNVLEKACADFPDSMPKLQSWLGDTCNKLAWALATSSDVKLRDPRRAVELGKRAVELAPNNAQAHNNLAWLYATCPDTELRDPEKAVELAKKAVELRPKEPSGWNTLGVAQYRAGDLSAAIEALSKSMELHEGGDAFDWFFLAMAHARLGQADEAHRWHQQAVEWVRNNEAKLSGNPQWADELRRFGAEAEEVLGSMNESEASE